MEIGSTHAGKIFIDMLGKCPGEVTIDQEGRGEFSVKAGSVSVWVEKP